MEPIYGNSAITFSRAASSEECSPYKDVSTSNKHVQKREDSFSKRTKVLLLVLGLTLTISLGGLGTLWMIHTNTLADFDSLKEQLSAQVFNSATLKDAMTEEFNELTSRYKILRDLLSYYDAQFCNVSVNGWTACHGKLYFFSSDKLNWSSSRDACVSRGADLVNIISQSEQDFLVSKNTASHWIGLNDLETEGRWVWVNNQTLDETGVQFWFNGNPRQPNNQRKYDPSGENCASLGDGKDNVHTWFDASCRTQKRFICETKY